MPEDIFNRTNKTLEKKLAKDQFAKLERNRNTLLKAVGTDLAKLIAPAIQNAVMAVLGKQVIKVEAPKVTVPTPIVNVKAPDVPVVNVPTPIANVTVPPIKIPDINVPRMEWPSGDMPIKGSVSLEGISPQNPLSVQLRDSQGNPVDINAGSNTIVGGGGGGKRDHLTIRGYDASAFSELQNADGRVRVSVETGGSGLTDAELRASSVPVAQASGANWSVNVASSSGSLAAALIDSSGIQYSGSNPLPVDVSSVTVTDIQDGAGDSIMDAANDAMQVNLVASSGSVAANIVDSSGVAYTTSNPLPVDDAGGSLTVDGTVTVDSVTNSVAAALVDSGGVQYSTSNPVPIDDAGGAISVDDNGGSLTVDGTVTVDSVTNSVAAALVDSGGVQYSTSNPLPIDDAGGSITVDGTVTATPSGTQDVDVTANSIGLATSANQLPDGHNVTVDNASGGSAVNIQDGGNSITVDGTVAVSGVSGTVAGVPTNAAGTQYDSDNPQPVIETVVRSGRKSAYTSILTGTETALLAGESGYYHDLVMIMCANQSDAATYVDVRQTTGGNVQMTIEVPAEGTAGVAPSQPLPQDHADASWTVDLPDITGTTIDVTASFTKVSS